MVLGCWRKLFTAAFSDIANQVPPERIICLWIYQWETLNHKSVSLLPSEPDATQGVQMNWWVKVQSWLVSSDFALCSFPFLQNIESGKQLALPGEKNLKTQFSAQWLCGLWLISESQMAAPRSCHDTHFIPKCHPTEPGPCTVPG